jgi:hypothetical protein
MEEEFKQELAEIWDVEDEDELPDSLQVRIAFSFFSFRPPFF